jgi:tetratricopeptide (TPR) repeat protein
LRALASPLAAANQYDQAEPYYRQAVDQFTSKKQSKDLHVEVGAFYLQWGKYLAENGNPEKAIEMYKEVEKDFSDTPSYQGLHDLEAKAYFQWVTLLQKSGNYDKVIEVGQILRLGFPSSLEAKVVHPILAEALIKVAAASTAKQDFKTAVDDYELVISDLSDTSFVAEANQMLPDVYLSYGKQLHSQGEFESAETVLLKLQLKYPASDAAGKSYEEIGQVIIDWSYKMTNTQQYLEAMDKALEVKDYKPSTEMAKKSLDAYTQAATGLAGDTGSEGQQAIQDAYKTACDGQKAENISVALFKDKPSKALACDPTIEIPANLQPATPGEFRYVVKETSGTAEIETCPYNGGYRIVRSKRYVDIQYISTESGKLAHSTRVYGSDPDGCADTETFTIGVYTKSKVGGDVSNEDVLNAIKDTLK